MQLQLTQKEDRSELFEKIGSYLADLKLKVVLNTVLSEFDGVHLGCSFHRK